MENIYKTDEESMGLLKHSKELYQLLLLELQSVLFEYDIAADVLYYSMLLPKHVRKEVKIEKYKEKMIEHVHADFREKVMKIILQAGQASENNNLEFKADLFGTGYRWYRTIYKSLVDNSLKNQWLIGRIDDINEEKLARQELVESVSRDILTKLYNRKTTEKLIDEQLRRLPEGEKGILVLLDVDDFKQLNDQMGHLKGDEFLKRATQKVKDCFRGEDIIGRIGGDVFVVFLHGDFHIDDVERKASSIMELFSTVQVATYKKITCSIGIAVTSSRMSTYTSLMENADKVLHKAKARGKSRYIIYEK
jgi:diguanylate cyclase (GGDEF)-like protein